MLEDFRAAQLTLVSGVGNALVSYIYGNIGDRRALFIAHSTFAILILSVLVPGIEKIRPHVPILHIFCVMKTNWCRFILHEKKLLLKLNKVTS